MGRAYEVRKAAIQKNGAAKAKIYSNFAKEIYIAAKNGGTSIEANDKLKGLVEKAKRSQVPSDIINRAIDKVNSGVDENYQSLRYEGFGPGASNLIVDCLTDNVNRTVGMVRPAFTKCNGKLGVENSVSHFYENLAIFAVKGYTEEEMLDLLMEQGVDINMKVCHNVYGSNLLDGATTAIIKSTKGKTVKADALVLEVDERYLKFITKYIKANIIAINNITRDQPPRQGNYEEVFNEIVKGLKTDTLILNADDPLLKRFEDHFDGKIVYYGIDKNQYSFKELDDIKNTAYCPKCHTKLVYNYYHYSSVGDFECPNCDFDRGKINYEIDSIKDNVITINNDVKISVDNDTLFNLYNIVNTYSVAKTIGLKDEDITKALNADKTLKKLYNEYTVKNRKYTILNCKAENNATYNLNLLHIFKDKEKKTLVIGHREISRRYNHFDLSWLWDINFELLKDNNVDKIICAGPHRYDIAVRIKYAGFEEKNIIIMGK